MDYELATKISLTAMLFMMLFIGLVKFHGDEEPVFLVKAVEASGFIISGVLAFVFSLISIWIR